MATLYAQDFALEFSYHDLNRCSEIKYSFEIKLNDKPFFNPDILSKKEYYVKDGKFLFADCVVDKDWLYVFFDKLLKTKKGGKMGTAMTTPLDWLFEAITWEDRRAEQEKSWEEKTVVVTHKDGTITHEPYTKIGKMVVPFFENNIEFIIEFPYQVFDTAEDTTFKLSVTTNFTEVADFLEELEEEMKEFYKFFGDRIAYFGDGKYREREDFDIDLLDDDEYMEKKCAEWNNQKDVLYAKTALTGILNFMENDSDIATIVTRIFNTIIPINVAEKMFFIIDTVLKEEKDEELIEIFLKIKKAIAIVFPNVLTDLQRNDALRELKKEDIPEEIYEKNKTFYLKYLEK